MSDTRYLQGPLWNNTYVVVMAGGIEGRFWPLGDETMPKQFLDVMGQGKTLLQMTVDRFADRLCPVENIWVVTSENFRQIVINQLPQVPDGNILAEPCRRNTSPGIAYASWVIKSKNPQANVIVTPSYHYIDPLPLFCKAVSVCIEFASETDSIVTMGIRPDYPATEYGYIEADLRYPSPTSPNIFRVDSFKEKPEMALAERYVREHNFFWNSGIFIWNINTIVNAYRVYQPHVAEAFETLMPLLGTDQEHDKVQKLYENLESISIDYAIMEKTEEIYVYPSEFEWSDLGSYSSLKKRLSNDLRGNACVGNGIRLFDTDNCIIHVSGKKQVIVQGMDGFIISEYDDKLLICRLSDEQRIDLFRE